MSEESGVGVTPRDREQEAARRVQRKRRRIVVGAVVGLVAAIGVAEVAGGLVSRAIDATGWTCGGWERIEGDKLDDMRILRFGTPQAREQGFDPDDFTDLPPGLAEPSLTTAADPPEGGYDPMLYPMDGGVVIQGDGYESQTWVGVDARTGDPLWGFASQSSGVSAVQGVLGLLSGREDGRTDLTTFDPRTGDELACVRLPGEVTDIDAIGDRDVVLTLHVDSDDEGGRILRLDPRTGDTVWERSLDATPASVHTDGGEIVLSSRHVGAVVTRWGDGTPSRITVLDPATGEVVREHESPGGLAVISTLELPDGGPSTLALEMADEQSWREGLGQYVLLDGQGDELWRAVADVGGDEVVAWPAGEVLVVIEDFRPIGLDMRTGDALWRADGSGLTDEIGVLATEAGDMVVLSNQRAPDGAGFRTEVIDPRTGSVTVHDAPLRSFQLTDGYVLSTTDRTQIVIPLSEP